MHLQLDAVEASLEYSYEALRHATGSEKSICEVLGFSEKRFPTLSVKARQPRQFQNTVRTSNYEFVIQALYTFFTEYLKGVLFGLYEHNPMLVVGKSNSELKYSKIVELGSYERIQECIVEDVFRKLESKRSTRALLQDVLGKTGVNVDPALIESYVMFSELRHILVHRAGKLDAKFVNDYSETCGLTIKEGREMPMAIGFVRNGIDTNARLVKEIDSQLVSTGYLAAP